MSRVAHVPVHFLRFRESRDNRSTARQGGKTRFRPTVVADPDASQGRVGQGEADQGQQR